MNEEIDYYLANIEEYVFDEKKIVTCSWLSKALGIHTNLSKQLLHTFFEQSPKKDELSLTYLLIGSPDNDGRCQISIVKDKDLDDYEGSWKAITSKHIYSVQKCSDVSDLNVLYTAQKGETTDTLTKGISAIDFNCNERDDTLIAKLRSDALPEPSKQPLGTAKKTATQPPAKTKSPAKNKEDKHSEDDKAATSKGKGSVIPTMFKNSKPAGNKTSSTNKPAEKSAVNSKKPQGIGAFFSKATNKQSNEKKKPEESEKLKEEKESNVTEKHSPSKENKQTLNIVKEDKIVKKNSVKEDKTKESESPREISPKSKKNQTKQKAPAKKGNSKKGSTKKVEKEQKKRKRLVVASDSESENSCEGEDEEMREPTPEPEPTVVPDDDDDDIICATPEPATRKRKKKLINKTFKTPDGYMMTKKEWVDVSCSEEEEESVPEKKFKGNQQENGDSVKHSETTSSTAPTKSSPAAKKGIPKNKKASPQKTKQASLTSFFKKK